MLALTTWPSEAWALKMIFKDLPDRKDSSWDSRAGEFVQQPPMSHPWPKSLRDLKWSLSSWIISCFNDSVCNDIQNISSGTRWEKSILIVAQGLVSVRWFTTYLLMKDSKSLLMSQRNSINPYWDRDEHYTVFLKTRADIFHRLRIYK